MRATGNALMGISSPARALVTLRDWPAYARVGLWRGFRDTRFDIRSDVVETRNDSPLISPDIGRRQRRHSGFARRRAPVKVPVTKHASIKVDLANRNDRGGLIRKRYRFAAICRNRAS